MTEGKVHLYEYNYDMPETAGIYEILNTINGKGYVGQSRYLPARAILYEHEHNYVLQKAYTKYGIENFIVILLETCSVDSLDEREIYWISELHTWVGDKDCRGYNLTPGGRGFTGVSEEERLARSLRMIGNTINLGRIPTDEARAHMRASAPKTHSAEHNRKVGETLKARGISPSQEARDKSAATNREKMKGNKRLLGRKFINNGNVTRAIYLEELEQYLSSGWVLGRLK